MTLFTRLAGLDIQRQRMADLLDMVRWINVTAVQPYALRAFLLARVEEIRAEYSQADPTTDDLEAAIRRRIDALSCSEAELKVKNPSVALGKAS
jgi:predicted ArsR family transcriptional regulator